MEYIYAALLLHKLGKTISEEHLHKVISATGIEVDEAKIKTLIASLKDVDIDKELESGIAFAASATASGKSEAAEEKKEEKEKPSEAAEGLSSLFG